MRDPDLVRRRDPGASTRSGNNQRPPPRLTDINPPRQPSGCLDVIFSAVLIWLIVIAIAAWFGAPSPASSGAVSVPVGDTIGARP